MFSNSVAKVRQELTLAMPMGEAASDMVGAIWWLVTGELNLKIVGG